MARTVKWILLFVAFCLATAIAVPFVLWKVKIQDPQREISARTQRIERSLARMEQRLDELDSLPDIPASPGAQDRLEDEWVDAYLSVLEVTAGPLMRLCEEQERLRRGPFAQIPDARGHGLRESLDRFLAALRSPVVMLGVREEWLRARLRLDITLYRALAEAGMSLADFETLAETIEWRFLGRRELIFLSLPEDERRGFVTRLRAVESYDGLLRMLEASPRSTALREKYEADRARLVREMSATVEKTEATRTLGRNGAALLRPRRKELEMTEPECLRWLFIR